MEPKQTYTQKLSLHLLDKLGDNMDIQPVLAEIKNFAREYSNELNANKNKPLVDMPFGKYKGRSIESVALIDMEYIIWLSKLDNIKPNLKLAVDAVKKDLDDDDAGSWLSAKALDALKRKIRNYHLIDRNKGITYKPITLGDTLKLIHASDYHCIYCDIKTTLEYDKYAKNQLTLERKFNGWDHSYDNCEIACFECNMERGARFSFAEFLRIKNSVLSETL